MELDAGASLLEVDRQHLWLPKRLARRHSADVISQVSPQPADPQLHAFGGVILWCWAGLYHQCKEVQRTLESSGHYDVRLEYRGDFPPPDEKDDKALHIFLPAHEAKALPLHYILYQTEQLNHPSLNHTNPFWPTGRNDSRKQTAGEAFEGAIEVWEYSLRQIKAFEELEKEQHSSRVIKFRHVPFSWFPVVPIIGEEEKNIAVLHYGAVDTGRRKTMLDDLKGRGIDIHVAAYSVWGAKLSLLIRRSKIVLNLHYHEAKTLETCRIMESISLGAMIISEPGVDEGLTSELQDAIVFAEGVDAIAKALKHYTSDEAARRERQTEAWKFAKEHYALQKYLTDIL